MLSRRTLIVATAASFCVACSDGGVTHKPALATLTVSIPDGATDRLLSTIRAFASKRDYVFRTREVRSSIGTRTLFELRGDDIWIEGLNPLTPVPPVLPDSGGPPDPHLRIDESRFTVMFFEGRRTPSESALEAAIAEFTADIEASVGASISRES
jgi:hypothetical protein